MPQYEGTANQITKDPGLASYMNNACWSSRPCDENGQELGEIYAHRLTKKARKEMAQDWADFFQANIKDIVDSGLTIERVAMNFWLTRNGHGAGFWDEGLGELGDRLTEASKTYGSVYLYTHKGWIYAA